MTETSRAGGWKQTPCGGVYTGADSQGCFSLSLPPVLQVWMYPLC